MGGGCTAPSVVGGWAVSYVGIFLRPVRDLPFYLFLKYRPPTRAWEYHRPHCCTPLSFTIPYVLLQCHTVALLLFCFLSTYIEDDTAPICFLPPYRPATGNLREYHMS